ncbi:TlpA family protein disulfide reductase [Cryptosporangium sp. NPDC051539]|uniref:TlpA family protein disulfide reductase n=1 Tax=Cryptosporangium sp. NPDC051539 TaxID=3363962 RepID=UPI00378858C1
MTYVVAALVVTNVLTLLNLLLLFGVIRRLREQQVPPPGGVPGPAALPVGTLVEAFATTDVAGHPLRRDDLPHGAVIAFFSPGCTPCEALLPKFIAHAERLPDGRRSAVAVVVGASADAAGYVAELSSAARVVVEDDSGGVLTRAFGVTGYPTVFQLDGDGRLLVSDASSVDRLAVPAA